MHWGHDFEHSTHKIEIHKWVGAEKIDGKWEERHIQREEEDAADPLPSTIYCNLQC